MSNMAGYQDWSIGIKKARWKKKKKKVKYLDSVQFGETLFGETIFDETIIN
jgi:hypothetical protein